MNKKYILYIFVALIIITNSSYAFPTRSTFPTRFIFPTRSKPMSKRAEMVPMSKTSDIPPEEGTSNITESSVDDVNNINSVGLLDVVRADGLDYYCTAAVINTNNGNIAITSANCLWDHELGTWNSNIYFYPGYNNGQPGKVGKVTGYKWFVWSSFMDDITQFDYGFIKFYYQNGKTLQGDTGSFDYDLVIPKGSYQTTVFGYPYDDTGDMNCAKTSQVLCEWQGNSFDFSNSLPNHQLYRGIPIDVGYGASGSPWISNYDPNTNAGTITGVSHGLLPDPYPIDQTASWVWLTDDFTRLLNFAESS